MLREHSRLAHAAPSRQSKRSGYRSGLARQLADAWLRTLEGVTQLDQIRDHGFGKRAFDLRRCHAIVVDEERDVARSWGSSPRIILVRIRSSVAGRSAASVWAGG